ncbi:NAD(P)H-binding protein [Roseobacter sp. CCS2]|uniref:NAD(P)H-binding protein n=1 Tax=Roseobacter sp. CCS2 TaxID=391593 RepID=UPI0000F404F1|nr:NAD(P)H-binding protein [Roseobacter sp. CCS2]EBA13452.1 hypothetical protein RCCS2_06184 [Roseobacter sp. CCS2]
MILITTPTGDIGSRVFRSLSETDIPLRVIARDPAKLPTALRDRIDIVEGSHGDADVIGSALTGVRAVFWLPPGSPIEASAHAAYVDFSRAFAKALPGSDVTHVVGISALGRGWPGPAGLVTASIAMDDLIGKTGVAYRALCCASLMDNLMRQLEAIRGGALYALAPPDRIMPLVAKADVAREAVRLLTDKDWTGVEEVPMVGPENLSHAQMAEILSDVLGRSVAFHETPMPDFAAMLRNMGASDGMVHDYAAMMTAKYAGLDEIKPSVPRDASPTSFRSWVEDELKPAFS